MKLNHLMFITLSFYFTFSLSCISATHDYTGLLSNRHIYLNKHGLTVINNKYASRRYNLDLEKRIQVIEKVGSVKDPFNKYKVTLAKNKMGRVSRLTEGVIRPGDGKSESKKLTTSKINANGDLTSHTVCSQDASISGRLFGTRKESIGCLTYTKNFCENFKKKMSSYRSTFGKKISPEDMDKCQKMGTKLAKILGNLSNDINRDKLYKLQSTRDSDHLDNFGEKLGSSLKSSFSLLNSYDKKNKKPGEAINKTSKDLTNGLAAYQLVRDVDLQCTALESYFRQNKSKPNSIRKYRKRTKEL